MKRIILTAVFIQAVIISLFGVRVSADPSGAAVTLDRCITEAEKVVDYTAVIHQRQRIGGELKTEEVIAYRFKRPNSVYIRWIGEVNNGMEVVFREGHNDNKLTARLSGVLGAFVFSLEPGSKRSLVYTRHPINESSLIYLMNTVKRSIRYSDSHPKDALTMLESGTITTFGSVLSAIVITTPYGEGKPYYAPKSVFGIDEDLGLPRYFSAYGLNNELWEEYRFAELKVNGGLADSAFELRNDQTSF